MADEALEEVVTAMCDAHLSEHLCNPQTTPESAMRNALAAAEALGFKLVAREATPKMTEAGRWPAEDDGPVACWRAMWDAAPSARDAEGGA